MALFRFKHNKMKIRKEEFKRRVEKNICELIAKAVQEGGYVARKFSISAYDNGSIDVSINSGVYDNWHFGDKFDHGEHMDMEYEREELLNINVSEVADKLSSFFLREKEDHPTLEEVIERANERAKKDPRRVTHLDHVFSPKRDHKELMAPPSEIHINGQLNYLSLDGYLVKLQADGTMYRGPKGTQTMWNLANKWIRTVGNNKSVVIDLFFPTNWIRNTNSFCSTSIYLDHKRVNDIEWMKEMFGAATFKRYLSPIYTNDTLNK